MRNDPGDKACRLHFCDGQADPVDCDRSLFCHIPRAIFWQGDLEARIRFRFCKIDDAGGAIDVTLHEMSSEACVGDKSALEIDDAVALERAEVGTRQCFLQKIKRDLFVPM